MPTTPEHTAPPSEERSRHGDPATLWTQMWNQDFPASELVAPACRVHFGRKPRTDRSPTTTGPGELQAVIDEVHRTLPGARYSLPSAPIRQQGASDQETEMITLLWNVTWPTGSAMTGIDLLQLHAGAIVQVWSITGDVALPSLDRMAD